MPAHTIFYEPKKLTIEFGENDGGYYVNTTAESTPTTTISQIPSYLTDKLIVIDSIHSGTGRTQSKDIYNDLIAPLFSPLSISHEIYRTTSPTSIADFARDLYPDSTNTTILFISGDSSINEFINGLLSDSQGSSITVFPIPGGTGNSLALSLDITSPLDAIHRLLHPTTSTLPLYLYDVQFPAGSQYLLHDEPDGAVAQLGLKVIVVLSWAFHASLVADSDTPELRKHGLERFQIAALQNLNRVQKYEGETTINGSDEEIAGPFAYWLVVSSRKFEPTFEISPKGDILKDELYLVAFNTKEKLDDGAYIMDIMKQMYDRGSHVDNSDVIYKKLGPGDDIVLSVRNAAPLIQRRFCVDGRIVALPETSDEQQVRIRVTDNTQHSWRLYIIH
ncbi:Sphingoid long-chain bases kinase 1 [Candida viswanathii]|uniref:Sphingoid long-chain bases kinase 1 n=1 Tax=Candida viswanathii TaxID=5486 RepID=A0A367Y194_9ASCO|nr:Sphingoid long-chain bases kinase 1 [Candida viswanathii]